MAADLNIQELEAAIQAAAERARAKTEMIRGGQKNFWFEYVIPNLTTALFKKCLESNDMTTTFMFPIVPGAPVIHIEWTMEETFKNKFCIIFTVKAVDAAVQKRFFAELEDDQREKIVQAFSNKRCLAHFTDDDDGGCTMTIIPRLDIMVRNSNAPVAKDMEPNQSVVVSAPL